MRRHRWGIGSLLLTGALAAGPATAVDWEKLVMPGPVIQGHAEYESECGRCHAAFRTESQSVLCTACHEDVGADIDSSQGFHGRAPGIAGTECRSCHTEHEGRDADVVTLDRTGFDHDLTDHPLRGAHVRTACDGCHAAGRRFREAPSDCFACHEQHDPHSQRLGTACADCHVESSWAETRFDHDKTDFPLVGGHRKVDCGLCHTGERYDGTPTDCRSCHQIEDVHMGSFGPDCGRCHHPRGWSSGTFDHDRDTDFPLRGEHRGLECRTCHREGIEGRELPKDCVSCHRSDDAHRGRNGDRCDRCHNETSWETEMFDHGKMTEFPLRGAHREVKCRTCHPGTLGREDLGTRCIDCHADDDVHAKQLGGACADCHNERSWTFQVLFEHDITKFPLLGMHAVAACEQCHPTPRYKDASSGCGDCHEDVHQRRLGSDCQRCHNPNGWELWRFDHARETTFELSGSHADLHCHECHRTPVEGKVAVGASCRSCHSRDDRHGGGFGHDCGRCHDTRSWDNVTVGK